MAQKSYTTEGRIHEIKPLEEIGEKRTPKQIIILEVDGYGTDLEYAAVEFFGKNADKTKGLRVGDEVTVEWNLKGRLKGDRCWTTLSGWKIEAMRDGRREAPPQQRRSAPDRNFSSRPERPEDRSDRERLRDPQPSTRQRDPDSDDIDF